VKVLLLFSLFAFSVSAQSDTVKIVRSLNYFPSISGYQMGFIPYFQLCDSTGLQTSNGLDVVSFQVHYSRGINQRSIDIQGNQIPDSVCVDIGLNSMNSMVFITEIKAFSTAMDTVMIMPLNLIPIKK
jgi:hypothetical protein